MGPNSGTDWPQANASANGQLIPPAKRQRTAQHEGISSIRPVLEAVPLPNQSDPAHPSPHHQITGATQVVPQSPSTAKTPAKEIKALSEEEYKHAFLKFEKIRSNIREELNKSTKTKARLMCILKVAKKKGPVEPDLEDLLADIMEDTDLVTAANHRMNARLLRGETEGDTTDPVAELERTIRSTEGDFDLIVDPTSSIPHYAREFRQLQSQTGALLNEIVVTLILELHVTPELHLDIQEISTESSEFCDTNLSEKEIERKTERLRRLCAKRAQVRLQDCIERAREVLSAMQNESEDEDTLAFASLKSFIAGFDIDDTYSVFIDNKNSLPQSLRSSNAREYEVKVRVALDPMPDLQLRLPTAIQHVEKRNYPMHRTAGIIDRRYQRMENRAARIVLEEVKNTKARILEHAKECFERDCGNLVVRFNKQQEQNRHSATLERIRNILSLPELADLYRLKLKCFGSVPLELSFPGSDLDVTVNLPDKKYLKSPSDDPSKKGESSGRTEYPAEVAVGLITHLAKFMERGGMSKVTSVLNARVPLLKFIDPRGIHVDLAVNNVDGPVQMRYLREHLKVDDRIRDLAIIIRYWAKQRGVSGLIEGYINPLGWTVMVIYFMQHIVHPPIGRLFQVIRPEDEEKSGETKIIPVEWVSKLCDEVNCTKLSELVLHFFQFFSSFSFSTSLIALDLQHPKNVPKQISALTIDQPVIPNQNIVGYVAQSALDETVQEMKTAVFRIENLGDVSLVFDERVPMDYSDDDPTDED